MDILAFKFGLNTAELTAGAKAAVNSIVAVKQSFTSVARAAAPLRSLVIGVKVAGDALWKLPDQMRALKAGFDGLALPIKLAASAETTAVSFRTLVGDTQKANAALAQITKLAAATPFEFPELAGAARSLVAFGEGSTTVAETLRKIGDVSSGVNAPITDLATIYGKARVAGVLMSEDINQLLERGIPILQEFAKQTGRSAGEIKDMASQGQITFPMLERAFTDLTSGAGKFSGMMEQASRTMEGRLSTLADSFKGVMVAVGEGLNEALKPLVEVTSTKIDGLRDKAQALGRELAAAVSFGKASFDMGNMGQLIVEAFKAGGLDVADQLVKAFSWGGKYLAQTMAANNPLGSDGSRMKAATEQDIMERRGMDYPGLGIKALSESAAEASRVLATTVKGIKDVANINTANARRTEKERQSQGEANRARANKEAAGKEFNDYIAQQDAILAEPTVPMSGKGKADYKTSADYDAAQGRARRMTDLDGPRKPAAAALVPPAVQPFPASEDVGNRMPSGMPPATGGTGRRTIKGAGYRGPREEEPEEGGRRTIKGAGYRPKGEDGRGGMARTGGRAGEQPKGDALAARAAEAVLKFLPEIYRELKEIPMH